MGGEEGSEGAANTTDMEGRGGRRVRAEIAAERWRGVGRGRGGNRRGRRGRGRRRRSGGGGRSTWSGGLRDGSPSSQRQTNESEDDRGSKVNERKRTV